MVDRQYIRRRARYWRTVFAEDSRRFAPIATAWREERERRTGSTRPYNGRRSHQTNQCRGKVFRRPSEFCRQQIQYGGPSCHDPRRHVDPLPFYHVHPVYTFDDWGDGPMCVSCGKPKEVNDGAL